MRSLLTIFFLSSCDAPPPSTTPLPSAPSADTTTTADAALADVLAVAVDGDHLAVTVRSTETGCEQYADWWEVITPEGGLVYRRVLGHSHPDEQPFTRDGGPVVADPAAVLIVRAHMNPGGYGGAALQGSLTTGFTAAAPEAEASFAAGLAMQPPLPEGCAF